MRMSWLMALLVAVPGTARAEATWERVSVGPDHAFLAVDGDPSNPKHLLSASLRTVYQSEDGGQTWQPAFPAPGESLVTDAVIVPTEPPTLLVTTDRGVHVSWDAGRHWRLTLRKRAGADPGRRVAVHPQDPDQILTSTDDGLWLSWDGGRRWTALDTPPGARRALEVAWDPRRRDLAYVLTDHALHTVDLAGGWREVLATTVDAEELEVEESDVETGTGEEPDSLHHLSAMTVDPAEGVLYLAVARGLLASEDSGLTWRARGLSGAPTGQAATLLAHRHSPLIVLAAGPHGVGAYLPHRDAWAPMAGGLLGAVRDLALAGTTLWAATDQGLYRFQGPVADFPAPPPSAHDLLSNFTHEPTIRDVQEATIRYAEVHPEKIARWRRQAALKALLPSFSVGFDADTSQDTSVDEGSFPNFQVLETTDRDHGFDFSVSWDLADLIWSTDQTSIDVRSKLMVQLREDLVDQVTRLYYERRRLQVALLSDPPGPDVVLEKELRVQELTALIDGLTGGAFSRAMRIDPNPEEGAWTGGTPN